MNTQNRQEIQAFNETTEEVLTRLQVAPDRGLDEREAGRRRALTGPNILAERPPKRITAILLDQVRNLIVWLLMFAAGVSLALEEWLQSAAILVVILINTAIGFTTEFRATRSMESLRRIARVHTTVLREGKVVSVPAEALVPGDIVVLEAGDVITADLRLIEGSKLQCDESTLSGESLPVAKQTGAIENEVPLFERNNMAFKGSAITRGSGQGVVVATGSRTELGQIATLAEEAAAEASPLERRLARLSAQLLWVTLALTVFIVGVGVITGKDPILMLHTGIALAVAAIPEGLPIVATLALARGMWRMARRNVLIERLAAVETLGATTLIFTDKTGTLTENRMTVCEIVLASGAEGGRVSISGGTLQRNGATVSLDENPVLSRVLEVAVLCSNATLDAGSRDESKNEFAEGTGDPMEVALLSAGASAGLDRGALLKSRPEVHEEAFDPEIKMMATTHAQPGGAYFVAVKGAPEVVLSHATRGLTGTDTTPLSNAERGYWQQENTRLAAQGIRVLGIAMKETDDPEAPPYSDLTFLGLVGLLDPPRADVGEAVESCKQAGIDVVMVTGDQAATAQTIARAVGIMPARRSQDSYQPDGHRTTKVHARVSPKQKLDLIADAQAQGHVVAMTGDGVNDAPALRKADIGIAMGLRGTQVAREASDMVLRDDAFSSIVAAVEQGRIIFGNIRKFVVYLLSCNLSEVLVVFIATISGLPLPLLPLQILFLNMVTDVFPAFALGAGEGEAEAMDRPPRDPKEAILARQQWIAIAAHGISITTSVLTAFGLSLYWLEVPEPQAVTTAFLTLALAQLWHVFNMRDAGSVFLRNEITRNPMVWGALALCCGLLAAAVYLPGLSNVLEIAPLSGRSWLLVGGLSLAPTIFGQLVLSLKRR